MILDVIRWVALIPIVYIVPTLVLAALLRVAVAFERSGWITLRLVFTVAVYFVFGAVMVLLAVWIAPNHKKLIGLLVALFSIVEAWRRCHIYAHFTRMAYPNAFATALG